MLLVNHGTRDATAATCRDSCEQGTGNITLLVNHWNGDIIRVPIYSRLGTQEVAFAIFLDDSGDFLGEIL